MEDVDRDTLGQPQNHTRSTHLHSFPRTQELRPDFVQQGHDLTRGPGYTASMIYNCVWMKVPLPGTTEWDAIDEVSLGHAEFF